MSTHLESIFNNLRNSKYKITSPRSKNYNCISWAADETYRLWWPVGGAYWPPNVTREETLESFVQAFRTLGYRPCDNELVEKGFEKVAIYVDFTGTPTHMARQLNSGKWTSKIGALEDIEHDTLQGLAGSGGYGLVRQLLKRRRAKERNPIFSGLEWLWRNIISRR